MKTLSKYFIVVVIIFVSCSKDELAKNEMSINKGPIVITKVSGPLYKNKILAWNEKHSSNLPFKNSNDEELVFDYDNLAVSSIENEPGNVIVANDVNYDDNLDVNYGIGYYQYNNEIVGSLIIELKSLSDQKFEITYFSAEANELVTLQLNLMEETIKVDGRYSGVLKATLEKEGWGQRTMDCLSDAYTRHGFISVLATVQTAFIPATAAALAIACGIKNI